MIDQVAATDQAVYLATDPVSAVRASDGSELWASPHTALYGPVESAGTVYVAEGTLYALRARDGGLRWQYPADVTSHPVVAGGMLYTLGVRAAARGPYCTRSGLRTVLINGTPGAAGRRSGHRRSGGLRGGRRGGRPARPALGLAGQRRQAAVARPRGTDTAPRPCPAGCSTWCAPTGR